MTPAEHSAELAYLIQERLGIICDSRTPDERDVEQANREAEEILRWIDHDTP